MTGALAEAAGGNPRETIQRLEAFSELIRAENKVQNLVSHSTIDTLWSRHIIDSVQLCRFAPLGSSWLDIGSGAGLPGIVIAIVTGDPITLVEPRRLRAAFLARCARELGLDRVTVEEGKVERTEGRFDIITARAVAPLDRLFAFAHRLSHPGTRWILPKGRSGAKELAEALQNWQGRFRTEPSITDEQAVIVVAEQVEPRFGARGGAG